jgi:hypothetical protein
VSAYIRRRLLGGWVPLAWDATMKTYAAQEPLISSSLMAFNARYAFAGLPSARARVGAFLNDLNIYYGFTPGTLQATVALYNRYAADRQDPVLHKAPEHVSALAHPPFGAFDCTVEHAIYAAFTLGGLRTGRAAPCYPPPANRSRACSLPGEPPRVSARRATAAGSRSPTRAFFGRLAGRARLAPERLQEGPKTRFQGRRRAQRARPGDGFIASPGHCSRGLQLVITGRVVRCATRWRSCAERVDRNP